MKLQDLESGMLIEYKQQLWLVMNFHKALIAINQYSTQWVGLNEGVFAEISAIYSQSIHPIDTLKFIPRLRHLLWEKPKKIN